jgi:hypothetical protein
MLVKNKRLRRLLSHNELKHLRPGVFVDVHAYGTGIKRGRVFDCMCTERHSTITIICANGRQFTASNPESVYLISAWIVGVSKKRLKGEYDGKRSLTSVLQTTREWGCHNDYTTANTASDK